MRDSDRAFFIESLKESKKALKANSIPAIILWLFGGAILIAYYTLPQFRWVFDKIENIRTNYGYVFLFVSTSFFGAILPSLFRIFFLKDPLPFSRIFALAIFWGLKGIEVDTFYIFQNWVFDDNMFFKICFDQFIYVPLWGLTSVVLFYHWLDCKLNLKTFKDSLGEHWYRDHVFAVMIPNWGVWVPAVMLIYLLPLPLQLPLMNLTLAFWVMILAYLTHQK